MSRSFRRLLPILLIAPILTATLAQTGRAAPVAAETISLTARPAYEGLFRPNHWMPIIVELANEGPGRIVEVRVSSREGARYTTVVELPNRGRKAVPIYVYLTPASRRLRVQALDAGQELAATNLQLPPLNPRARYVAIVGPNDAPVNLAARLSGGDVLVPVTLRPGNFPEHGLGLSVFETIILEDASTEKLNDRQRVALSEWVLRGGQLILGGGDGLQRTLAGLPETLRTVTVTAVEPVAATSLFGAAAGAGSVPLARLKPLQRAGAPSPYAVPLVPGANVSALEQSLGRGAITVTPWPLVHPAVRAWVEAPEAWEVLLRPLVPPPPGFEAQATHPDSFLESSLAASLTSLPVLEFPPLGLLAGLVLAYIILVGPVTYLVLRRFDRQAWGWIAVPAVTLVFAGLTYGVGYARRGGDVLLASVNLVETFDGDAARLRSFIGLFSPERRMYSLRVAAANDAAPLLRPVSIQGPWDPSTAGGGVFLQEGGAGAQAHSFEVAQWSMRAVTTDVITSSMGLAAQLTIAGDELRGEVENQGDQALLDVALVQGDRVARLGDLAPGERRSAVLRRQRLGQPGLLGPVFPLGYLIYHEEIDQQGQSGVQPIPAYVQQRIRILDAYYSYGLSLRNGQPLVIAWQRAPALAANLDATRTTAQHTTLITATPQIRFVGNTVTLGRGWLATRFESAATVTCTGGQGLGLLVRSEPAVMSLVLPRDLYGLRPEALTLETGADGPWQNTTVIELYNWDAGVWEAQTLTHRSQPIEAPERFLSSNGVIRVRLSNPLGNAGGCIYVDATLKGSLP
ncbi:MAG: hypothetical protein RMK84_14655 [Oscillochloridaceae bacterium]|nr:hypothetical protein [Chloroflexaceae bacterium]MDW8391364.1 hypothetical protein [Oscillochloridaceae bacterium]